MKKLLIAALCVSMASACSQNSGEAADSEKNFWNWFKTNESRLAKMESVRADQVAEINSHLKALNKGLAFEIGRGKDGKNELAISADGNPDLFPEVIKLCQSAPQLSAWTVRPFRQRAPKELLPEMAIKGQQAGENGVAQKGAPTIEVKASQLRFNLTKNEDHGDLTIYIEGFNDDPGQQFMANVLVQQALGEYDAAMRVGELQFKPLTPETEKTSKKLIDLPEEFDKLLGKSQISAATGEAVSNTEEADGPWTVASGMAKGKPSLRRLNIGLKPGEPSFPFRAVYTLSFLHPDENGMPGVAELNQAAEIEDELYKLISKKHAGRFASIQTSNGQRKFLFYVASEEAAEQAKNALKIPSPYTMQLTVEKDPSWTLYQSLRDEQH